MKKRIDKKIVKMLENNPKLKKVVDEFKEKWLTEILSDNPVICESLQEKIDYINRLMILAKLKKKNKMVNIFLP